MIHGLLDVLQPNASDDEDDDQVDIEFALRSTGDAPSAESVRAVVVCGPGAATAFALSAFSLVDTPWSLGAVQGQAGPRAFPPPPKPARILLRQGAQEKGAPVAIVLVESAVAADFAGAWAEALLAGFSGATEIIFLDRIYRAAWYSSDGREKPQEPYLTGLWTAAWQSAGLPTKETVAPLPKPNCIEGLGAALLSQCEELQKPCLAALTLQDGAHLGEGCVRGFERLRPVLIHIGLVSEDWQRPSYREAVRKVVPPPAMSIYA